MFESAPLLTHGARSDQTIDFNIRQLEPSEYVARISSWRRSSHQTNNRRPAAPEPGGQRHCGFVAIGMRLLNEGHSQTVFRLPHRVLLSRITPRHGITTDSSDSSSSWIGSWILRVIWRRKVLRSNRWTPPRTR